MVVLHVEYSRVCGPHYLPISRCQRLFKSHQVRMRHPSLMTETSLPNNRSPASDVILWMFIFIVALIIFNVPLGEVFVPFSAILVAVSFAIGSTVQNLLASLLVVVVLRPFDVGDR